MVNSHVDAGSKSFVSFYAKGDKALQQVVLVQLTMTIVNIASHFQYDTSLTWLNVNVTFVFCIFRILSIPSFSSPQVFLGLSVGDSSGGTTSFINSSISSSNESTSYPLMEFSSFPHASRVCSSTISCGPASVGHTSEIQRPTVSGPLL